MSIKFKYGALLRSVSTLKNLNCKNNRNRPSGCITIINISSYFIMRNKIGIDGGLLYCAIM